MHSTRHEYDEESSISSTPKAGNSAYSLPAQSQAAPGRPDEMAQRIDDLHRREQELAAREAQLNAKAEHIRKHGRVRLGARVDWRRRANPCCVLRTTGLRDRSLLSSMISRWRCV